MLVYARFPNVYDAFFLVCVYVVYVPVAPPFDICVAALRRLIILVVYVDDRMASMDATTVLRGADGLRPRYHFRGAGARLRGVSRLGQLRDMDTTRRHRGPGRHFAKIIPGGTRAAEEGHARSLSCAMV